MEGVPTFLLLALVVTWLAWFAVRRKNQQLAARLAVQQEQHSYTLDARESATGRGFDIVHPDGRVLAPEALDWTADGLMVADVEDFRPAPDDGGSPGFAPGMNVELIPHDGQPGRVDVWNTDMTACAGSLPAHAARLVLQHAGAATQQPEDGAGVAECLVLWEHTSHGARTGLRLLIVRDDMHVDS